MTTEEALKILRKDSLSNLVYYYSSEELQDAIDTIVSQPSLPSNLDEAAEEWCKRNNKGIALCADDADIEKTACHFYELGMAVGDLKIKGWVERDMGGQVILTVPHRGAADEYILLENNTFPNLRPDNTRIEVDLIIRKK